jgi:hypothetical protein
VKQRELAMAVDRADPEWPAANFLRVLPALFQPLVIEPLFTHAPNLVRDYRLEHRAFGSRASMGLGFLREVLFLFNLGALSNEPRVDPAQTWLIRAR